MASKQSMATRKLKADNGNDIASQSLLARSPRPYAISSNSTNKSTKTSDKKEVNGAVAAQDPNLLKQTSKSNSKPRSTANKERKTSDKKKANGGTAARARTVLPRTARPSARVSKTTIKRGKITYKKAQVADVQDEDGKVPNRGSIGQEPIIMEVGA